MSNKLDKALHIAKELLTWAEARRRARILIARGHGLKGKAGV